MLCKVTHVHTVPQKSGNGRWGLHLSCGSRSWFGEFTSFLSFSSGLRGNKALNRATIRAGTKKSLESSCTWYTHTHRHAHTHTHTHTHTSETDVCTNVISHENVHFYTLLWCRADNLIVTGCHTNDLPLGAWVILGVSVFSLSRSAVESI